MRVDVLTPNRAVVGIDVGGTKMIAQAGNLIPAPLKRAVARLSSGRKVISDYLVVSDPKGTSDMLNAAAVAREKLPANLSVLPAPLPFEKTSLRGEH